MRMEEAVRGPLAASLMACSADALHALASLRSMEAVTAPVAGGSEDEPVARANGLDLRFEQGPAPGWPAFMGSTITVSLDGLRPGDRVGVASSTLPPVPDASCPLGPLGPCLDLQDFHLEALVTVEEPGPLRVEVPTPVDAPQPVYYQALSVFPAVPTRSDVLTVNPESFRTDSDGDRAFDPVELDRGTDPFVRDTDGDGVRDGRDPWPLEPGPLDDGFVRRDVLVTDPDAPLVDPEFSLRSAKFVWQSADGADVWMGEVDLQTGAFVPRDGRGERLFGNVAPLELALNGIEWAESARGSEIVFARDVNGRYALGRAFETATGWRDELIDPRIFGAGPIGQLDLSEPVTRIGFWSGVSGSARFRYSTLENPSDIGLLPAALSLNDTRYAEGLGPLLVGTGNDLGLQQTYTFDVRTRRVTRVGDRSKQEWDPRAWFAPDLGGPAVVTSRGPFPRRFTEVAVYRQLPSSEWVLHKVIEPPPSHPFVIQPRYFVWNGESYVFFIAAQSDDPAAVVPCQVWMANLDPNDRLIRRLDDTPASENRKDPEAYTPGARPWIYYQVTELLGPGRTIRRVELGLPARQRGLDAHGDALMDAQRAEGLAYAASGPVHAPVDRAPEDTGR